MEQQAAEVAGGGQGLRWSVWLSPATPTLPEVRNIPLPPHIASSSRTPEFLKALFRAQQETWGRQWNTPIEPQTPRSVPVYSLAPAAGNGRQLSAELSGCSKG